MSLVTLTDAQIQDFVSCGECVENPGSKARIEGKHRRRDCRVQSEDGRHDFVLFTRQSTVISHHFSAGLRWKSKTGEEVILMRGNELQKMLCKVLCTEATVTAVREDFWRVSSPFRFPDGDSYILSMQQVASVDCG